VLKQELLHCVFCLEVFAGMEAGMSEIPECISLSSQECLRYAFPSEYIIEESVNGGMVERWMRERVIAQFAAGIEPQSEQLHTSGIGFSCTVQLLLVHKTYSRNTVGADFGDESACDLLLRFEIVELSCIEG
jgi:hypothetical protein